jgi:hypothetical protein
MVDLARHDQLPTVLVKKRDDRLPDVSVGDEITAAYHHGRKTRTKHSIFHALFNQKTTACVKISIVAVLQKFDRLRPDFARASLIWAIDAALTRPRALRMKPFGGRAAAD